MSRWRRGALERLNKYSCGAAPKSGHLHKKPASACVAKSRSTTKNMMKKSTNGKSVLKISIKKLGQKRSLKN